MTDHSFTIRKAEEGQFFHIQDDGGEWKDFQVTEIEEYRSSYKADNVVLEEVGGDASRSFSKSRILDRVRDEDAPVHRGRFEECGTCG